MFYIAGVGITLFLTVVLIGKPKKSVADIILASWLIFIGLHLYLYYLLFTGDIEKYPPLFGIQLPIPLLHGPFLYLYIRALTQDNSPKLKNIVVHYIPAALSYLYLIPNFFLLSRVGQLSLIQQKGAGHEIYLLVQQGAIIISGIAYVQASLVELRRYKVRIENEFSNTEKINLNWLRYLIYSIGIIWVFVIIGYEPFIFSAAVLFVCFMGYFGIRQEHIFHTPLKIRFKDASEVPGENEHEIFTKNKTSSTETDYSESNTTDISGERIKYERSGLSPQSAEHIFQGLKQVVEKEKIFTNPELTVGTLAEKLRAHPNHVSQVINTYTQKTFYDFINFHRVEEFKRLAALPENNNFTLVSLAYDCGFNSKASFNRNFKKLTSFSPSEYVQQLKST